MNDGSIRIGTKIDLSGIKAEIKALEKELKSVQKEADKLNEKEAKVKGNFAAEREIDSQVDKRYSHSDDIDKREAEALAQVKSQQEELNQKTQEYNALLDQANAKLQQQQAIAQASKELDDLLSGKTSSSAYRNVAVDRSNRALKDDRFKNPNQVYDEARELQRKLDASRAAALREQQGDDAVASNNNLPDSNAPQYKGPSVISYS